MTRFHTYLVQRTESKFHFALKCIFTYSKIYEFSTKYLSSSSFVFVTVWNFVSINTQGNTFLTNVPEPICMQQWSWKSPRKCENVKPKNS